MEFANAAPVWAFFGANAAAKIREPFDEEGGTRRAITFLNALLSCSSLDERQLRQRRTTSTGLGDIYKNRPGSRGLS